jgi:hypothetical protein
LLGLAVAQQGVALRLGLLIGALPRGLGLPLEARGVRADQTGIFDFLLTERRGLSLSLRAVEVFRVLGPRAAPAIPKLTEVVMKREALFGRSALDALQDIGEQSTPAIISVAGSSNSPCRIIALSLLGTHTNSPAARAVLISAQRDPDLDIRRVAIAALKGE